MDVYRPRKTERRPAVVVALHLCGGTGPSFFQNTEFASLADQHGFVVSRSPAGRNVIVVRRV